LPHQGNQLPKGAQTSQAWLAAGLCPPLAPRTTPEPGTTITFSRMGTTGTEGVEELLRGQQATRQPDLGQTPSALSSLSAWQLAGAAAGPSTTTVDAIHPLPPQQLLQGNTHSTGQKKETSHNPPLQPFPFTQHRHQPGKTQA